MRNPPATRTQVRTSSRRARPTHRHVVAPRPPARPRRAPLAIGPSGNPRTTPRPGTDHAVRRVHELGLGVLEMAWGNGVRIGGEACARIAAARAETGIELTAHAPYYVNLCADGEVAERSVERLVQTGEQAARCGASSFVFHAGFYQGQKARAAGRRVCRRLATVVKRLRDRGVTIDVRPELTGRPSQAGSLDELLDWCEAVEGLAPCLDFSHQYARTAGGFNDGDAFRAMLARVQRRLGRPALKRLHVHVSGIEYGPSGERRHVRLEQSAFDWRALLGALHDAGVGGWLVCESPAVEDDAAIVLRAWQELG